MEINKSLEELGLSQIEIAIYLYLLSKGESLGSQIYKENLLDKSSAYKAIAQLERRGLVISSGDSRNQIYKVAPKEQILDLFENRKQGIEQSKTLFINAFADIEKYSAQHYQNENVQIFTGQDAHDRYHETILKGKFDLIRTIAASDTAQKAAGNKKLLDKTNTWFIKERVARNILIRVLYDKDTVPDKYDTSNPKLLKECRRYSERLNLSSMMSTFGDRVGFATIKNGKFWSLIIKDQLIVDLLNSIYDSMWNKSDESK
ncbi:MAG: hypothetical protein UT34_C0002G0303 [candidate division WS6 bacterium GW2011_GWF2_39_15]|uniref:Transcription regulator TrmB N-terminal domain-containing protein n=1 Tax=candidate division WS6 bacterium GW2011_GWF2_39_15 TaxID=1619100 RepID=A0A0G0MZ03_9BACT|nr:MAG: hypothetical protein UT34_C0002G0303 [candidate division WS6 bacterium GW2011_GWF2_39_15]